jgi:uncharacterized protein YceK
MKFDDIVLVPKPGCGSLVFFNSSKLSAKRCNASVAAREAMTLSLVVPQEMSQTLITQLLQGCDSVAVSTKSMRSYTSSRLGRAWCLGSTQAGSGQTSGARGLAADNRLLDDDLSLAPRRD